MAKIESFDARTDYHNNLLDFLRISDNALSFKLIDLLRWIVYTELQISLYVLELFKPVVEKEKEAGTFINCLFILIFCAFGYAAY